MDMFLWVAGYLICGWVTLALYLRAYRDFFYDRFDDIEYGWCAAVCFLWPGSLALLIALLGLRFSIASAVVVSEFDYQEFKTRMAERKNKSNLPIPHEPEGEAK
jgi:hypothetical protein